MLPGETGSCWVVAAPSTEYPPLQESIHAETVVVGAGIVGLTTALRLCQAGRSVIVVKGLRVGGQVTGRSTAKITTQHALIYRHLIDTLGRELAQSYADANSTGAACIKEWVDTYGIACDLEAKSAYAFTRDETRRAEIVAEAEAARELGLTAEVLDRAPLPFETAAALRFPDQAQFNPVMYLVGLAAAVVSHGGQIFENSRARLIDEASRWRVVTDGGTVHAEYVVVATNMTVKSPVGMANRTQPRSHTAMAFRVDNPAAVDGMFIGIDNPTRSLRMGRDADGPLLVALGPKFNTGQDGNVAGRFVDLEAWARANLPVGDVAWRWCNEDYDTADRVPYVGHARSGKSAGISHRHRVQCLGHQQRDGCWNDDRGPRRRPIQPVAKALRSGAALSQGFSPGAMLSMLSTMDWLSPFCGEGGVIVRGEEKIAAWRDEAGELHTVSASCTHKGCTVTWNNADRTWDCPCHGSIFAADGSVIHGPARKPLAPAEL